jgi:hypothetical protein
VLAPLTDAAKNRNIKAPPINSTTGISKVPYIEYGAIGGFACFAASTP